MSVDLDGPEGRNVHGSFHEDEIEAFFSNFMKWDLIYSNFDAKFFNVETHKSEEAGIDFLYHLYEPFISNYDYHGVIVEVKGRKDMNNFNVSKFSYDLYRLKEKMEKAASSTSVMSDEKIKEYGINYFQYGILCYRFDDFDYAKFQQVIKQCKLEHTRRKNNFPVIFVLSNDRLSTFCEFKKKYNNSSIKYYYPYYLENFNTTLEEKLSLFYLFSDLIMFAVDGDNNILSFDEPSSASFKLIEQFCGRFNHNISKITLAKADYSKMHIYESYKSQWDANRKKPIELKHLKVGDGCLEPLMEVFTNES